MNRDTLCFTNNPSQFTGTAAFPLQAIADSFGACQGISAISRAFQLNARFTCSGERPSFDAMAYRVERVMSRHNSGCSDRIEIPGFCDLRELCEAHQAHFERLAVETNAALTLRDTFPHLEDLLDGASSSAQFGNVTALRSIYRSLTAGKPAMMLYPMHVVEVTSMTVSARDDGNLRVRLRYYDPNENFAPRNRELTVAPDWSHTIGDEPIFNVSPVTFTTACRPPAGVDAVF